MDPRKFLKLDYLGFSCRGRCFRMSMSSVKAAVCKNGSHWPWFRILYTILGGLVKWLHKQPVHWRLVSIFLQVPRLLFLMMAGEKQSLPQREASAVLQFRLSKKVLINWSKYCLIQSSGQASRNWDCGSPMLHWGLTSCSRLQWIWMHIVGMPWSLFWDIWIMTREAHSKGLLELCFEERSHAIWISIFFPNAEYHHYFSDEAKTELVNVCEHSRDYSVTDATALWCRADNKHTPHLLLTGAANLPAGLTLTETKQEDGWKCVS